MGYDKWVASVLAIILVAVFAAIQLPTLWNLPWEKYDSWRQGDTYSIAVNFFRREYNILKPQFNYDGAKNNYVQLELQIMPFLSATVFKLINRATPVVPRGINLLFFLGSALYLYLIMRRFAGVIPSVLGLAVYLFMPVTMLYSRAIMPEAPALFFYCGGVYYLLRWHLENMNTFVWLSAVFTALAITQKAPLVFVGILILYVFIKKLKKDCLKSGLFYGYGLIALAIPAVYYFYASSVATFKFVNGITQKHILSSAIFSVFSQKGIKFFLSGIPEYFGPALTVFGIAGLLLSFSHERRFIMVWAAAILLEWMMVVAVIRLGYYLIFMAPVFAVLSAVTVSDIWKWRRQVAVFAAVLLVCSTIYHGMAKSRNLIKTDEKIEEAVAFIKKHTGKDDIIAVTSLNPIYLSATGCCGYRANIKCNDHIPESPEGEIRYFIENGVTHLFVVDGETVNDNDGYLEYLKANYPLIASHGHCMLFRLAGF